MKNKEKQSLKTCNKGVEYREEVIKKGLHLPKRNKRAIFYYRKEKSFSDIVVSTIERNKFNSFGNVQFMPNVQVVLK